MSEVEVARLSHDEDPVPPGVDGASYAPRPGRYQEAFASRKGRTGLGLIALIVLAAVLGPIFLAHGPYEQGPDALTTPNGTHLLGTDEVGRDLLARVLAGTRVDLIITLIAVPIAAIAGTLLGLVGLLNRTIGSVAQRVFDVLLGVPAVLLGVSVAIAVEPGVTSVIVAVILVTTPIFGRQTGSAVLGQVTLDYVSAAAVLGFPRHRIMLRHVLPNIIDGIYVRVAVVMSLAISIEGGLSVVGLGVQSPQPSLGSMIKDGGSYLYDVPLYALAPVMVVIVLIVGYTMVSDALNEAVLRK